MESRVIVTAIVEKDGKYLFGQKPRDIGPYPNTWHLLGGGVKLGEESCEEALRREIREEAGIELAEVRRVSFDEDYEPNKHGVMTHYVFLVYWARCVSETTRAADDITEIRWIDRGDLGTYLFTRPSTKLFHELGILPEYGRPEQTMESSA
ncbi:MAG: NUDIX domain-containing protein [Candidatus Moraniibacteriota bacterium]|nr:MAG: NUDIX domain-containing protein [Candidatus Moranbacteria bacterium]